jgi:hypothetical protein
MDRSFRYFYPEVHRSENDERSMQLRECDVRRTGTSIPRITPSLRGVHADTTTRLRFPDRRERGAFRGVNGAATSENHSSATLVGCSNTAPGLPQTFYICAYLGRSTKGGRGMRADAGRTSGLDASASPLPGWGLPWQFLRSGASHSSARAPHRWPAGPFLEFTSPLPQPGRVN